ncbi:hypothetical protein [Micromonospora sp. CPCC 206061]|uniref:hypothetical protein n=1 Tax=Micromonospora sp. CPCC 206061 TaxID=3122410 RepID=UPI002FEF8BF8
MLSRRFFVSMVALLVAVAGAPGAAGAAVKEKAQLGFTNLIVPVGFDAKRHGIWVGVPAGYPEPLPGSEVRLTLDLADLAGVVTVTNVSDGWTCEPSGTTLTCVWNALFLGGLAFDFAPAPQAREGDSGRIPIRLTIAGLEPATGTMTVRVASTIDLADATGRVNLTGAAGDDVTTPIRVRNAGPVAADGVVAFFQRPYRLHFTERYGNCDYSLSHYGRAEWAACRFDTAVPPGATFQISPAPAMRIAADAAPGTGEASVGWYTPLDWAHQREMWEASGQVFTRGSGRTLRLIEGTDRQAANQTDTSPENNWGVVSVEVTGRNEADVAAVPATITGRVGQRVTMRLGTHNNGPTSIDFSHPQDEPAVFLQVTTPPGVTAVASRSFCMATRPNPPDRDFAPGAAEYVCVDGSVHPAGETIWFEITFRIDRRVPGAEGRLATSNFPGGPGRADPDPDNDTAPLKVRVLGGDGGGSAGGLPVTGAGTGSLALIGAALLLTGALTVLITGHRGRTRRTVSIGTHTM